MIERYLRYALETGDPLNDWLTHLPSYLWPLLIHLGQLLAR